jgi:steroid delta-isomerase-like uncharacterized protein
MTSSDLERTLDGWAAAWSSHDAEKVIALFTDDCVFEDVTFNVVLRGKEQLRGFADGAFNAVPDITFELTGRVAAGERAAIEWVMAGTHVGDFPGLPATGKRFSVRGATILELESGKISRESDYWDAATFMKQVGLLASQQAAA